jgi:hypothetical protein
MAMYGYGYRYPRVPREVRALYTHPNYRYKWARAAIMNRGIAARSPWLKFLKDKKYLDQVGDILRKAGAEYRALYGVNPKYKAVAEKRLTKIENAIKTVQDEEILGRLRSEFGDKYSEAYVKSALAALQRELDHLKAIIAWGKEGQPPKQPSALEKKASGYGLRSGLGYGLEEGLGYGYFY